MELDLGTCAGWKCTIFERRWKAGPLQVASSQLLEIASLQSTGLAKVYNQDRSQLLALVDQIVAKREGLLPATDLVEFEIKLTDNTLSNNGIIQCRKNLNRRCTSR